MFTATLGFLVYAKVLVKLIQILILFLRAMLTIPEVYKVR